MGTRNLTLVWYKGRFVIAQYGQWDGYPDGQGKTILTFLLNADNITKLMTALDNNMVIEASPTELKRLGMLNSPVSPSLSRDTGAKILKLLVDTEKPVPLALEPEFAFDSLFCEFAYCVDLDVRRFETYTSWDIDEHPSCSDAAPPTQLQIMAKKQGKAAGRLVASFSLDALPSVGDYVAGLERKDEA